jgi:hypothetical protein
VLVANDITSNRNREDLPVVTVKNILVVAADALRRMEIVASLRRAGFHARELACDAAGTLRDRAVDAVVIGDERSLATVAVRDRDGRFLMPCPVVKAPSLSSSSWEYELLCSLESVL